MGTGKVGNLWRARTHRRRTALVTIVGLVLVAVALLVPLAAHASHDADDFFAYAQATYGPVAELNCDTSQHSQVYVSGSTLQIRGRIHSNADFDAPGSGVTFHHAVTYGLHPGSCQGTPGTNTYNAGAPANVSTTPAGVSNNWPGDLDDYLDDGYQFDSIEDVLGVGAVCDVGSLSNPPGTNLVIDEDEDGKVVCNGQGKVDLNAQNQTMSVTIVSHGAIVISGQGATLTPHAHGILAWTDQDGSAEAKSIVVSGSNFTIPERAVLFSTRSGIDIPGSDGSSLCIQLIAQGKILVQGSNSIFGPGACEELPPPKPALAIDKTPDAQTIQAGADATFTITLASTGDAAATNVAVSDNLPVGNTPSGLNWSTTTTGCSVAAGTPQVLTCNFASIPAGEQREITVTTSTDTADCKVLDNTANYVADGGLTGQNGGQITIECPPPGNPKCADLEGEGQDWTEFKRDPNADGTFSDGTLTVTITHTQPDKVFSWSSNIGVDAVFVKGGESGNGFYLYDPPQEKTSDTGLTTPGQNTISHISFCYDNDPPPPPTLNVVKTANPTSLPEPGGDFTFTVTVQNTSGESVTILSLVDDIHGSQAGDADCQVGTVLAVSASCQFSFVGNFTGNAGASETDTVTVCVEDNDENEICDDDPETVTITDVAPTVTVVKEASPLSLPEPGGNFTFSVTVTNTSFEPAEIVILDDDIYGALAGDADCQLGTILAPSASCSFSFQGAFSGNAGASQTDIVTACLDDDEQNKRCDDDDATVRLTDGLPTLNVTKTANPTSLPEPGGDFTFTVTVQNTSGESVTILSLVDDIHGSQAGDADCQVGTVLAVSASCQFSFVGNFTGNAGASETDTVTVCVEDNDENEICDDDPETVTITPNPGTIIIEKQTNADDGDTTTFDFTGEIVATLGDEGMASKSVGQGTYTVTESAKAGWNLTRMFCDDTNSTVDFDTRTVTFRVAPAETVKCTFENTKDGRIVVEKQTLPDGYPTDPFTFTGVFTPALNDGESASVSIFPGTYSLTETQRTFWDLLTIVCDDEDSEGNVETLTATYVVDPGEVVKCTFTNQKQGDITVVKQTIPAGGQQSFSFSASYDPDGFSLSHGQSNWSGGLTPGTYSVSESVPEGWKLDTAVCDDGSPINAIVLEAAEDIICTFTNVQTGTIIVEKQTNPNGAAGTFSFTGDAAGSIGDNGQIVVDGLEPGTYTSTEGASSGLQPDGDHLQRRRGLDRQRRDADGDVRAPGRRDREVHLHEHAGSDHHHRPGLDLRLEDGQPDLRQGAGRPGRVHGHDPEHGPDRRHDHRSARQRLRRSRRHRRRRRHLRHADQHGAGRQRLEDVHAPRSRASPARCTPTSSRRRARMRPATRSPTPTTLASRSRRGSSTSSSSRRRRRRRRSTASSTTR